MVVQDGGEGSSKLPKTEATVVAVVYQLKKKARRKEYGKENKESDDLLLYDSLGLDFFGF